MGLWALWMVAGLLVLSALALGWATVATGAGRARRSEQRQLDDLVRRSCADLDDEYRELLQR